MTKYQLIKLLFDSHGGQANWFTASNGKRYHGILQSIQREDGSGESFNLTVNSGGREFTFHVRTVD
jgi:hypothetical protein